MERVERIAASAGGMPRECRQAWAVCPRVWRRGDAAPAVAGGNQVRLLPRRYEPAVVLPTVLKVLGDVGCDVTDLSIGTPSLEDVFIHLTGRELR